MKIIIRWLEHILTQLQVIFHLSFFRSLYILNIISYHYLLLYIPTIAFFSFFFSDMKLSQYISSQLYFLKIHVLLENTHYWKIIFIFPFGVPLKCSMDIQSSNGKSLLYMYYECVSSYVTKMHGHNLLQALIFKTFYMYLK